MNKYIYLLVVAILFACQPSTEKPSIYKEVMAIHDEAMANMGTMMSLKKELVSSIDTAELTTYQAAIADLDEAHEHMMIWMREFSQQFPGEVNMDDSKLNTRAVDKKDLLIKEKEKVIALRTEINQAIETAQKLLERP